MICNLEMKTKVMKFFLSLILIVITLCLLTSCGKTEADNSPANSTSPVAYLTDDFRLMIAEDVNKIDEAVQLTSYNNISGTFAEDEIAWFRDDKTFYYSGTGEQFESSLFAVYLDDFESITPVKIDDRVQLVDLNNGYGDRITYLQNRELFYVVWNDAYTNEVLKYYNGSSSVDLISGSKIRYAVSDKEDIAYVWVEWDDTSNVNEGSWYRLSSDENWLPQYVCDGTIYPMAERSTAAFMHGLKNMANNDTLINVCENEIDDCYTVEEYQAGERISVLIQQLPWGSIGPIGVNFFEGKLSFYVSASNHINSIEADDEEVWSFYYYESSHLTEVEGEGWKMYESGGVMDSKAVNNELFFHSRYDYRYNEIDYTDYTGWYRLRPSDGELHQESIDDIWYCFLYLDSTGSERLLSLGEYNILRIYGSSNNLQLKDVSETYDPRLYKNENGEYILTGMHSDGKTAFFVDLTQLDPEIIEVNDIEIGNEVYLYPYGDGNSFLSLESYEHSVKMILPSSKQDTTAITSNVIMLWTPYYRVNEY